MIENISQEPAKIVETHDLQGNPNGFLLELFKNEEKTDVYLSATTQGGFKGYHLHRVRAARYVCLKGKVKIIMYERAGSQWARTEKIMDSESPSRLSIPKNVATGIQNIGRGEVWLVNYPDPAYDPALADEQVEYTQAELEAGVVK